MNLKDCLLCTTVGIFLFTGCTSKIHKPIKTATKKTITKKKLFVKKKAAIKKPIMIKKDPILTLKQEELGRQIIKSFPLKKDFIIGQYTLHNAKINLKENDQRIFTTVQLRLVTLLTGEHKGTLLISSKPLFEPHNVNIHLYDTHIEHLHFENKETPLAFSKAVINDIRPLIHNIFKQASLYSLEKEAFLGRSIKSVQVKDKLFFISYGL